MQHSATVNSGTLRSTPSNSGNIKRYSIKSTATINSATLKIATLKSGTSNCIT